MGTSTRITNADLKAATGALARALARAGWIPEEGRRIDLRAPYGQVLYVVTVDQDGGNLAHDVPGFEWSGGSGLTTKREAVERMMQATRTLFELSHALRWSSKVLMGEGLESETARHLVREGMPATSATRVAAAILAEGVAA